MAVKAPTPRELNGSQIFNKVKRSQKFIFSLMVSPLPPPPPVIKKNTFFAASLMELCFKDVKLKTFAI